MTKHSNSIFSELGNLPKAGIIAEIKRLYDEGYQLGLDEGKEVTRGKYLNIFNNGVLGNRKKWNTVSRDRVINFSTFIKT